ncbi:MAG: acyl-CoA thioesterase YciA [Planctomycetota bacterium]|jgi:acyl-CoA thioesterase YciA
MEKSSDPSTRYPCCRPHNPKLAPMTPPTENSASLPQTTPSIRRSMMPRDTNAMGTIFGGVILAEIDLAAGIEARSHCDLPFVTVALDNVEFKEPVCVGDLVSFYTETERIGRTSIRVKVDVWATKYTGESPQVQVTVAHVTMVAVNSELSPTSIPRPTRREIEKE